MLQTAVQLSMNLRDAHWLPVVDVNGVKWALTIDAHEVEDLVDQGSLIALNIALSINGRRELRILTRSIEHYRAACAARKLELTIEQILALMIPHSKPVIYGTEIDAALNCDPVHRQRLIHAEIDLLASTTSWRAGPGGSPTVTREAFAAFLKRRIL